MESEVERARYLWLLGRALERSDWRCFAYAVMSNHVHLALQAGSQPLAGWLRQAHVPFAMWLNERRERIGPVFVRGPRLRAVRPEGAARLVSYIHNNPVRARVVTRASDSD
ncbi:MAG: hypothetical protein WKG01_34325, partial [Kofleriaceae bacterium]